ncbi:MAG: amidohydrolase [Chloroflexi bacterium]|jgi:amidohydrolase|nr:amidohydrolase [Chloroflexota bacterium]
MHELSVLDEAQQLYDQLVAWRRDLHKHPEIGLEEHRTAKFVAETLRDLGYTVETGIAHTGVVGLLENGDGPVIMNRVDMDALPIQEENDAPYASEVPGMMHACGHDAHVAIGLGIATLMAQHQEAWRGTLKLIFQPGEEGMNGAEIMVNEGVLENPRPDKALAIHVWNMMPVGVIGAVPGSVMAAAERWQAELRGKGGHAAHPEDTVDPLVAAAHVVTALQTVVSRNVGAQETAVVTVGMLRSGDTFNVIPDTAELRGTIRTYDPEVRETVVTRVREIVEGTGQAMGCDVTLQLDALTPAVDNDAEVTHLVQSVITDLWGDDALDIEERTMGSEDAAFFMDEIPGCYIFIGSGPEGGEGPPHHNPHFDIEEQALVNGVALVTEALCRLMPTDAG